jgi:hypothetical protein
MWNVSGYYLLATIVMAVVVIAYWARPPRRAALLDQPRRFLGLFVLFVAGLGLCLWSATLEQSSYTFEQQSSPIAIAIAFDLSPSMLAIPNPKFGDQHLPRFERGKSVLLEYFRALEEQGEPVIVSVVGFAKNADIIMGWDQSTTQVHDILEYAVAPSLFGSSGSSIEAAAKSLTDVFAMLPQELRTTSRQLAIIVSDGEDTMRTSSFEYAKQELAASGFDTIALQTGLIDENEGVPTYGRVGEFTGFRSMRGVMYTVPDFTAMSAIADSSAGRGLHVRAEAQTAVDRMLQFTIGDDTRGASPDAQWLSVFGMFAVVSLLCGVNLR